METAQSTSSPRPKESGRQEMDKHLAAGRPGGTNVVAPHRGVFAAARRRAWLKAVAILTLLLPACSARAQLSFTSAIALAVKNSPRVKMAQDDLNHALAALSDARDVYIPTGTANGGLGRAYGITLNVPTILTVNTQSLVYNAAQRDYIRAARDSVHAAQHALDDTREQVEEDTANAYLSLDGAERRHTAIGEEHEFATRLVSIVQDRLAAGIESELDLKLARRTELDLQLQQLTVEDEIASLREQLAGLTGLPANAMSIAGDSVPSEATFAAAMQIPAAAGGGSAALLSLEENARSKQDQAHGDSRYALRPQFLFQAQYGRISPIDDVSEYYNLHGDYNTFEAGLVIVFPFFDRSHVARARETAAEAMHAQHEEENLRSQQALNEINLQHNVQELSVKASLAQVDLEIAQDQMATTLAEVQSHNADFAGRPMTVKDQENAHLTERARYVDVLNAEEQLRKAQISLLRQAGTLDDWLASLPRQ